jgi:hypothetical protein
MNPIHPAHTPANAHARSSTTTQALGPAPRTWQNAQLLEALREQWAALTGGALVQCLRVQDGSTQVLKRGRSSSSSNGISRQIVQAEASLKRTCTNLSSRALILRLWVWQQLCMGRHLADAWCTSRLLLLNVDAVGCATRSPGWRLGPQTASGGTHGGSATPNKRTRHGMLAIDKLKK